MRTKQQLAGILSYKPVTPCPAIHGYDFSDFKKVGTMILFKFAGFLSKPISLIAIVLSVVIAINTMVYFQAGPTPAFLLEKEAVRDSALWSTCFYFHIVSACACLLCGAPLMIPAMLRFRRTHLLLGYVYFNCVLWVAAPTGLVISPAAKGGAWSAVGFLLTGVAWWLTTWFGYRAIQQRNIPSHVRWMVRSYSISLSAVSFRLLQVGFFCLGVDDLWSYVASVWLSLAFSVLLAEVCIRRCLSAGKSPTRNPFLNLYSQGAVL